MSEKTSDIKAIFGKALEIEARDERNAFLDEACGDKKQVRADVEDLLLAIEQAGSFMVGSAIELKATIAQPITEKPGTKIGPYKLLQKVGEGGMGVVYMADQKEPVKRRVALKIIKAGMDSKQVVARFEAERQALAMMDHPNIARLLDVGTTGSGRPYFVMELVKGVPITEYCDDKRLNVKQRLELFKSVCSAVQHAHQKGIIHRDLKPSNILVAEYDDKVVPKIIDFGLAKALHQSLTDMTMFTQLGQVVGTLAYMSPEQSKMNQLDVDTRTDIYSLGVLLYELLTGTTPFEAKRFKTAALDQVLKIIREEEPPKPSTRISESGNRAALISEQRQIASGKLRKILRGELDWVVMKSLEKDRSRRYETANGLAADVLRYLNNEPVVARPPSALYQMSKFARRYRNLVGFSFALSAFVVITILLTSMWLINSGRLKYVTHEKNLADRIRNEELPRIQNHIDNKEFVNAYNIWLTAHSSLPNDPVMDSVTKDLTMTGSIDTTPGNAKIYVKDWRGVEQSWTDLGVAPIHEKLLPKGMVRWKFEKKGFTSVETISNLAEVSQLKIELRKIDSDSELMNRVTLSPTFDFLMDRHETTNREFKEFVDKGGYSNRELWPERFYLNGKQISFNEARERFLDSSETFGPSNWQNGMFPEGEEDYPVRFVSWYEAYAYAKFRGKSLPRLEDWSNAADKNNSSYFIPLSNFSNIRVWPIGQSTGIGKNGLYDMAGNVREWCLDGDANGNRCTRGGSFNRPAYSFNHTMVHSPFERMPDLGFRCARYSRDFNAPLFERQRKTIRVNEHLVSDGEFEAIKSEFAYNAEAPFDAIDVSSPKAGPFIKIRSFRISAPYGVEESFKVHFLEPSSYVSPCQLVIYLPGNSASTLESFDDAKYLVDLRVAEAIAKSGRIVCWPEYFGTFERKKKSSFRGTEKEAFVRSLKDVSRALDFALKMYDVDGRCIGIAGNSTGGRNCVVAAAVDNRIKSMVLVAAGLRSRNSDLVRTRFVYAPFVKIPTGMICGSKDYVSPPLTSQIPLFDLIGTKAKKYVPLEDCYHDIPWKLAAKFAIQWFDESIGSTKASQ